MNLRFVSGVLLAAAAGFTAAPRAHAQIGVYLTPIATHFHNPQIDTGSFSFLGDTNSRWFGGVGFGVYDDYFKLSRVNVGIDLRDTIQHAQNASANDFGAGVRIVGKGPRLRPYAEAMVGAGRTKPQKATVSKTRLAWDVMAGVDYRLTSVIDFRLAEIGYGEVQAVSTGSFGNNGGALGDSSMLSVSSGLVFRFGH